MYALQNRLDIAKINEDTDIINSIKEDMISLGWNPILEFNSKNKAVATQRNRKTLLKNMTPIEPIDDISKSDKQDDFPIYVVLIAGKTGFSSIIKKYQNFPFTHCAISLDESLKKMYSFNLSYDDKESGKHYSGFSIENIKNLSTEKISVFTIFTTKENKRKIEKNINKFKDNIDKTKYSLLNILALPFNKIVNIDYSMICSQFVDTMLKICNMNNSKKDSSLVTPKDIYTSFSENTTKAYKIFEDMASKYKPSAIKNKLKKIFGKVQIAETYIEEVDSSIQFDEDGNLLIKHIKLMSPKDYEYEYKRSHKILVASDKTNNVEAIKYELCKLWFLNLSIENKLKSRKLTNKSEWDGARSKILTDFNKYLKIANQKDPKFIFSQYYNDSIYNIYETKVSNSTITTTIDILKNILK
jgi:hypothetical protein